MQLDSRKVGEALTSKGFVKDEKSHHKYFIYHSLDGKKTKIYTYMSHGGNKSLDDYLLGQMAKQCKTTKKNFVKLIECPLDQAGYEKELDPKHLQ